MKRLRSTAKDLRDLFESSISAQHIAEHLLSFDEDACASKVRLFMDSRNFDVVGVRRDGLVDGYVEKTDLKDGALKDHRKGFSPLDIIDGTEALLATFERLCHFPRVFVRVLGRVGGIVTRGDLQKAPVRMWLFGLITLVEMHLLWIIRKTYKDGSWQQLLKPARLKDAEELLAKRRQKGEEIDLAECLQLCDKRDIINSNSGLRKKLGYEPDSDADWEKDLKDLQNLRDNLAHAQLIKMRTGNWCELMELAMKAEELLSKCEELQVQQ